MVGFIMEKEKVAEELIEIVSEFLESETDGFEDAVILATNFSIENSISPDFLIELSCFCGFKESYSLAYIFSKTCAILSTEDIKKANAHYNAGLASIFMGRKEEAEKQYLLSLKTYSKSVSAHLCYGNLLRELGRTNEAENQYLLALKIDPKNVAVHSNYGTLLQELGRMEKAEIHYLLALKFNSNDAIARCNYGNLLRELGRIEEAKKQYKIATELKPENVDTYYNYGNLLKDMGHEKEAEIQYQCAIELDPKHVSSHYNYGNLLRDVGRENEAEIQYQKAIELDPENPNRHTSYSLLLLLMNLENEAIERANIASCLFNKKGDITNKHLIIAYLYECLVSKYYSLKKYQKSGKYAEISGIEYIEASKHAGEKFKGTLLTKGYTLKGRAKIRDLDLNDIQPPYNEEIFAEIIKGIYYASKYYKKAAEESPEHNPICNACSLSMKCLSEMLNCMLVLIEPKPKKIPIIEDQIKKWNEELANCKKVYNGNEKGDNLIVSLYKIMSCIEKLAMYKENDTLLDKIILEDHIQELIEIANKIEGPLQKIIETSAKQMDCYMSNIILHKSIGTEFSPETNKSQEFELKAMVEKNINSKSIPEISSRNQAVILTAIPEEYDAVRSHLTNLKEEQCKGTIYEIGQFVTGSNNLWNIAIVEIGMHNPNAALEAERASGYFKPNVILFVGVAGGIKDVNIGDVVAVTKAYGYEYGKETESFKTRPEAPESTYDLIQRARSIARNEKWIDRIHGEFKQLPKAFVGPIASGEKVLASTQSTTYELIRSSYNDALAIDMESVGFLRATHANRELMSIVIRGISDLINGKYKSDSEGSQELASRNAAAFAFELISKHNFSKKNNS